MMKHKHKDAEIFNTASIIFASFMTHLLKNMLVTLTFSEKYISEFVSLYLKPKKSNFK